MTRGVKVRLALFLALAIVGMVYVGGSYLGVVDTVLGRGKTVTVALPGSGGLYVGSEVDYRGYRVGEVVDMRPTAAGVDVIAELEEWAEVPRASRIEVASTSAVGEQYLNFVPESSQGPYLADGSKVSGTADALPPSTDEMLTALDAFVASVEPDDLQTVVRELGTMFRGNAQNLRLLLDSGTAFIDEATEHQDATIALLKDGGKVLETQREESDNIRSFASDLSKVTEALRSSDSDLQDVLSDGAEATEEVDKLVTDLRVAVPPLLSNLIDINQVINPRIEGLGMVFAILPVVIKNGLFFGTPGDGYGHITMHYNYTVPACSQGYLPPAQWPSPLDTREHPLFDARCTDPRAQPDYVGPQPMVQRGFNMLPKIDDDAPIYTQNPYRKSGSSSAKAASSAAKPGAGSLPSVVAKPGWEGMFTGGAGE